MQGKKKMTCCALGLLVAALAGCAVTPPVYVCAPAVMTVIDGAVTPVMVCAPGSPAPGAGGAPAGGEWPIGERL